MPKHYWVDTNVLLRYMIQDSSHQTEIVNKLMDKVDAGQIILHIDSHMVAECCYVLQGKVYNMTHVQVAELLKDIFSVEGLDLEDEPVVLMALDHYSEYRIDFEDAYLAAYAGQHKHRKIVTFNIKDFVHTQARSYTPEQVLGEL